MTGAAASEAALAEHGAGAIAKGSKSFALASLLFGKKMQADVHMLYAWCRHCDDVIDGQILGGDAPDGELSRDEQAERLRSLRALTERALRGEATGEPAFDGFAAVARRRAMPPIYPHHLLDGFAHDVEGRTYATLDKLMEYCYGVAGVVGVMMAIVMGVDKDDSETLDRACDLGLAFQLTNICRDVMDDAKGGRIYLPLDMLAKAGVAPAPPAVLDIMNRGAVAEVVKAVLTEADRYYASSSEGARKLPFRAAAAVLAARNVYSEIGRKVKRLGPRAWNERTVVSSSRKLWLAAGGLITSAGQATLLRSREMSVREGLWRRPITS